MKKKKQQNKTEYEFVRRPNVIIKKIHFEIPKVRLSLFEKNVVRTCTDFSVRII